MREALRAALLPTCGREMINHADQGRREADAGREAGGQCWGGQGAAGEDGILNVELDYCQAPLTLLPSFGDHAGFVAPAGTGQGAGNARSARRRDSLGRVASSLSREESELGVSLCDVLFTDLEPAVDGRGGGGMGQVTDPLRGPCCFSVTQVLSFLQARY